MCCMLYFIILVQKNNTVQNYSVFLHKKDWLYSIGDYSQSFTMPCCIVL